MDELKKRLTQQKRCRPQSPIKEETIKKPKFIIKSENSDYFVSLKLINEKNNIIIKCSPSASILKYTATIELEQLKEKNRMFNVCTCIEDAFKMFINLFNRKKVNISEENIENIDKNENNDINEKTEGGEKNDKDEKNEKNEKKDSINLILKVPNYIKNSEEKVSLELIKCKNINNDVVTSDNCDKNILLNNLFKDNNGINVGLELMQKVNELSRNDLDKNEKLQKLIINFNQFVEEVSKMKNEITNIKKHLEISEMSDNEENEENEEVEDENKINEENEDEKEVGEEEENSEDEEKEESKYNFNDIKEAEYQNKEDIQNLKEKLTKTLFKIKERNTSVNKGKKKAKEEIINLNTSQISQEKEQSKFKSNNSNISQKYYPQLSFYKNLTKKTTSKYYGDNNFIVFESINKDIILVYTSNYYSIHFFDIEEDKLIKNIAEAHKSQITNFRYIYDKNASRDLLLSIADKNKNIKIWDIKDYNCIINIEDAYEGGFLFSSCFLIDEINKKNYIISVNYNSEPLKIFNFEGFNIRKIDNNNDQSYLVDTFFNTYLNKYYIIVGNENFIVSYSFENGELYKKYYDYTTFKCLHMFFTLYQKENDIFLIEADLIGYVRMWNFDAGTLIKKYIIGEKLKLRGMCLWNENFLFVGASDRKVKLVDLKTGEILDNLKCNEIVCNIKKINSKKFGECLLMQGKSNNGQIKLWKNIN